MAAEEAFEEHRICAIRYTVNSLRRCALLFFALRRSAPCAVSVKHSPRLYC